MKCDQDLCLNFWYDLKKLLWQDELNPWVRCAFGNVCFSYSIRIWKSTGSLRQPSTQDRFSRGLMYIFYLIPLKKNQAKFIRLHNISWFFASYTPTKNAARFYVMVGGNLLFLFLPLFVQSLLEKNTLDLCLPWGLRQPWWQRQKVTSNNPQYQPTNGNMFIYSYKQLSTALNKKKTKHC